MPMPKMPPRLAMRPRRPQRKHFPHAADALTHAAEALKLASEAFQQALEAERKAEEMLAKANEKPIRPGDALPEGTS